MRAKFQVLIIPFKREENSIKYYIFNRKSDNSYQFISGGGEDNETILEAAIREFYEETSINSNKFIKLDSISSIPACCYKESKYWGNDTYVVPEYTFAIELHNEKIILSDEHNSYQKLDFDNANKLLKWDSNKTALWEINERIKRENIVKH